LEVSLWLATKISDVERSFSPRLISTIEMNEEANALILLSDGDFGGEVAVIRDIFVKIADKFRFK
jgi:hypothetical protein